jgi:hypothetical protein
MAATWGIDAEPSALIAAVLLLVSLDNRRRPDGRAVRIEAEFAQGAALPQPVPALIELDLDLSKAQSIAVGQGGLLVQMLFFAHEALDVFENAVIGGVTRFLHGS